MRHHVPAANRATEERQDAPLLERRREQASRRRRGGAEARSVFGRDQFVPGGGVAQGDRGVRRGRGQLSDAGLVPGGPLRGRGGRRLGGAAAPVRNASASSATVGRLLVGGPIVARAATRPVLGGAPAREPEANALGSSSASAGRLPTDRRLHREWFGKSAMADLLGADFGLAETHKLYACHGLLLAHKDALFSHLTERWRDLFNANFDVLLYDLTSTYFEVNASDLPEGAKRRHGYSRDKRPDCPQLVIALVVTPEGLPLAYEVLPGNTADSKTLRMFLGRIEKQYGKARRVWVMDRGVPTEAVLAEMRASDPPVQYLVGTPKGRLNRLEKHLIEKPWQKARAGVEVKLLAQDDELYVFAQSADRVAKERAMRRRQLKWLWARLGKLAAMNVKREEMLMKLGAARSRAPTAWRLVEVALDKESAALTFSLNRQKLRIARRREGRYLLPTNLTDRDPAVLWQYYVQLVAVEEAFKNLKGDLAIRPIFHHDESRIEAHIFIAFLAYALQVTLTRRLHALAPGLTARSALEKFAAVQMIDVHLTTTDGREIVLTRYTQPEPELQLLINQLKLTLPSQPPPKITAAALAQITPRSEDLLV